MSDIDNAKEKVALIVGGTSGIGKAAAAEFARRGIQVVITGKDPARGEAARREIQQASGNSQVALLTADLSLIAQTRRLAEDFRRTYHRLDYLVMTAGILSFKASRTSEGLLEHFSLNYLSKFVLSNALLDLLRAATPSRIVIVGAPGISKKPYLHLELIEGREVPKPGNLQMQSQFATDLFVARLVERLAGTGVGVRITNPGVVKDTNILRNLPLPLRLGLKVAGNFFAISPSAIGEKVYKLATSEQLDGNYFKLDQPITLAPLTFDREFGEKLWQLSEKITSLPAVTATQAGVAYNQGSK